MQCEKKLLLIVTGSIAAYKAAELCRLLIKSKTNYEIKVMLSYRATKLIGTLTFEAITGNKVYGPNNEDSVMAMEHITLAKWAETILIAPATANCIAKLSHGIADNLITSTCLANKSTLYIAPSMNEVMWNHLATQENIKILKKRSAIILGPSMGEQACGDIGLGRMLEPDEILKHIQDVIDTDEPMLKGLSVVITAGPTQEAIDPVRYLSNYSSGKMGYAIAKICQKQGAKVHLITGPSSETLPSVHKITSVVSANEMLNVALELCGHNHVDVFIGCAAVADYRPKKVLHNKLKKSPETLTLELIKNPDIVFQIKKTYPGMFVVGFAAETENLLSNATAKLHHKNLDMVIANTVGSGGPFGQDKNEVYIITNTEEPIFIPKCQKSIVAYQIVNNIFKHTKYQNKEM